RTAASSSATRACRARRRPADPSRASAARARDRRRRPFRARTSSRLEYPARARRSWLEQLRDRHDRDVRMIAEVDELALVGLAGRRRIPDPRVPAGRGVEASAARDSIEDRPDVAELAL